MSAADFARRSRSVVGITESIGMARTSSAVNIACLALHQSIVPSRVADNVGGQDRRQFALLTGQWNFPRSLQRIVEGVRPVGNRVGDPYEAVYQACGTGRRT